MLTIEFIAGFVSANGSFGEYMRNNIKYPTFQIKSSVDNSSLLNKIATTLGLNNRVYVYNSQKQGYALLVVRDRDSILNTIIPIFNDRLIGTKKVMFDIWKTNIINNCSTWKYRKIKTTSSH